MRCDFQVVIAQLESILLELTVLVNGRRLLLDDNLFAQNHRKRSRQRSKANKLRSKSSKDGGEKEIADQESIKEATVAGILSGDLSGADSVTNQLAATFSNQSFSNSVDGDGGALSTAQETFKRSRAVLGTPLLKSNLLRERRKFPPLR